MKTVLVWTGVAALLLLVICGIMWLYGVKTACLLNGWSDRGNFGQMYGALNTLFSGCAFAGFIIALILQQKELRLQREQLNEQKEELKLARSELTRAAAAQEKSQEALSRQASVAELQVELTTINNLVSYYEQRLAQLPSSYTKGSSDESQHKELNARITKLNQRMNQTYDKLMGQEARSG